MIQKHLGCGVGGEGWGLRTKSEIWEHLRVPEDKTVFFIRLWATAMLGRSILFIFIFSSLVQCQALSSSCLINIWRNDNKLVWAFTNLTCCFLLGVKLSVHTARSAWLLLLELPFWYCSHLWAPRLYLALGICLWPQPIPPFPIPVLRFWGTE